MPESDILVGLEIGTSKVCAAVGETDADGNLKVMGVGQARSRGVRKGEIVDPTLAAEDVRNAIVEAEQMADVEVRSVYLGVTGGHLRGFNNRGVHPVVAADREITEDDVLDVVKNAKAINLPAENCVVHAIRQHFAVDGQEGILNPVGMLGARMEVDIHVVHGHLNRLQNPIRLVKGLQLEVENVVFTGLASGLALLTNEQKEMGALVIDLGGGTTEFMVCLDGVIRHLGLLAVGGDHVTNDLAYGLKVPLSRAEQLKLEHGSAIVEEAARGRTLNLDSAHGFLGRSIQLEHLQQIVALRLGETLELVAQEVAQAGLLDQLRAGVLLAGGGARVPRIQSLAARVFGTTVSIGRAGTLSGIRSALDQPELAAAIGLLKFGSFQTRRRGVRPSLAEGLRSRLGALFKAVKP
jgi:cell division protein FtsA